jgi:hypothetical protein
MRISQVSIKDILAGNIENQDMLLQLEAEVLEFREVRRTAQFDRE